MGFESRRARQHVGSPFWFIIQAALLTGRTGVFSVFPSVGVAAFSAGLAAFGIRLAADSAGESPAAATEGMVTAGTRAAVTVR